MNFKLPQNADMVTSNAAAILQRIVAERTTPMGGEYTEKALADYTVHLTHDPQLPAESFRLQKTSETEIHIRGGDGPGIMYGCGKLLRLAEFGPGRIVFHDTPGINTPGKSDRGIYFAVHNYNTYQVASDEFIRQYIQDLALWGINNIAIVFHKFHFAGIDTPQTQEYIARLNLILQTAKSLGMKASLLITANDGYADSPLELRYKGKTPRNWGTELCISNQRGMDIIKAEFAEILDALTKIDQLIVWPYDSGGCGCEHCAPWGTKGYIKVARELHELFNSKYPDGLFYLSTWYFDYNCGNQGEWTTLFQKLENNELDWVDGILADGAFVNGFFPKEIVEHPLNKNVISFMEISMLTGRPFGGYGSNPVPAFMQRQWDISREHIIGGIPYSEGIYEDINKFIWSQLCWTPERNTVDIMCEYAGYEFSPKYSREIANALAGLEPARMRKTKTMATDFSDSVRIWDEISYYDRCLDWNARNSWRWRHNLLRAKIDAEMAHSENKATPEIGRAFDELFRLYRLSHKSFSNVRPYDVVPDTNSSNRAVKFAETGKTLLDFCTYRDTAHEDAYDNP